MSPAHTLTLDLLKVAASDYAVLLSSDPVPELFGVTDGKTIGTHVEVGFKDYVGARFQTERGNAAKGIDFPDLKVDVKATSAQHPQSSSPYRGAEQKVYGLGHHLLVFVYDKTDDSTRQAARLDIRQVVFVDQSVTADFQTTSGLRRILDNDGNVDDVEAFLVERSLLVDDEKLRALAERIVAEPPRVGCLTLSTALQWRVQYGRAVGLATSAGSGVEDLRGP